MDGKEGGGRQLQYFFICGILLPHVHKNVYFILQSTQFMKSIQMNYLHGGCISEAQHVLSPNESSGADTS
jgi:hypothetical protein